MKFDLYFAGSPNKYCEKIIEKNNNLRLMSYLNENKHILKRKEKGLKTFVDSGAFSAFTLGKEIDIDAYIAWLNEHDEGVQIAAELDMIPGKWGEEKTKAQLNEAAEYSWTNYLYMAERVKSPEKILPIYHQGEDFKYLKRMLEYKPNIPYIGISPSNEENTARKKAWIHEVFDIIKASSNPNVKTHAFGMTSLRVLEQYPFTSADSTSWLLSGANGSIMYNYSTVLVSEKRRGERNHLMNMPKPVQAQIEKHISKHGYTLEDLQTNYRSRIAMNIHYLTNWANNYTYKPAKAKQTKLF